MFVVRTIQFHQKSMYIQKPLIFYSYIVIIILIIPDARKIKLECNLVVMIFNCYLLATTACNADASTHNYIENNDQFTNESSKTKMITLFNGFYNNSSAKTASKKNYS